MLMVGTATESDPFCDEIRQKIGTLITQVRDPSSDRDQIADALREKVTFLLAYRDNMFVNLLADFGFREEVERRWKIC